MLQQNIAKIIKIWGNSDKSGDNYIFIKYSNYLCPLMKNNLKKLNTIRSINGYMKWLGKKLEVNTKITTYFAQHSWATLLKNSGTTTEKISEGLGHSNLRTTKDYLDSFPQEHKKETAKKLSTLLS